MGTWPEVTLHLCDSNVWLALVVESHVHHAPAQAWLDGEGERDSLFFCRSTQLSFLRLVCTAAVMAPYGLPPFTNDQAWVAYESLIADDRVAFLENEPDGIVRWWEEFSLRGTASPKLWMDAYLAAFARAAGYRLATNDRAFRQFRGLDLLVIGES